MLPWEKDGPYGGRGGSPYDLRDPEHKIKRIDAWDANWKNYPVLGALRFQFDDGHQSERIGGKDPHTDYHLHSFEFLDGERINHMTVFAGHNDGFFNGFQFHTTLNRHWEVGGREGEATDLPNLGNGEWVGATGRDEVSGADAVVDSMCLYFKKEREDTFSGY
ncbi:hypothetical protein BDV38DRAFT_281835 [Aspergillus pseudotamarii]|uniref:Jacalin-type lectin domain-containing protein n=1 Tax=Aspergillus pseudotamarii TaxID=132259 RepID=A0A5N6SV13_ASPPS|nr:uncharacterized protein BDV38DRAFT_281835 [Aspergillus pseudotamarii]KAE8138526.1 hypothetical protein BDV38DRAFT_281835 [Aspergillus pseudotamarii]